MVMQNILKYVRIDHNSSTPIAVQLSQQLSWLIASGEIKDGEKLPPAAKMAEHLNIHLHTARSAYQKLRDNHLVEIHRGSGTTVLPYTRLLLKKQIPDVPSFIIGVFIPGYHPFYLPLLQGIEDIALDTPTQILVCNTHDNYADRYAARLLTKGLDGLIMVSTGLSPEFLAEMEGDYEETSALPPIVNVDHPPAKGHSILFDAENAGFQATHHLIEHERNRIGLITCPLEWPNVNQIYQGYCRAINEAGLDYDPALISVAPVFELEAGYQALLRLLQIRDPPTAIFAIDDLLAIGAMRALKELKIQIPIDMAIVGNTNLQLSAFVDPPLTTVSAPAYEMGVRAIEILQKLIQGKQVRPKRQIIETKLIVRESCGCNADH